MGLGSLGFIRDQEPSGTFGHMPVFAVVDEIQNTATSRHQQTLAFWIPSSLDCGSKHKKYCLKASLHTLILYSIPTASSLDVSAGKLHDFP